MKIKAHKHKAKSNMVLHLNSVEEIEYEKLKKAVFNSDMEKLRLFARMLHLNNLYKRAVVIKKPV